MKVIITGSTGRVGGGVLERCLAHPQVTSVVALTRRPLDVQSPKLNNIIHKDYNRYNDSVIEQLKGAEACIWYISANPSAQHETVLTHLMQGPRITQRRTRSPR